MNAPSNLDPFHLMSLSEDIDQQCHRLVARELPKSVNEKVLNDLKIALRDQMTSLLTEMTSEWRNLPQETGNSMILNEDWVIPGVSEMAMQLPKIYGPPPESELENWHIDRVRWTVSTWLQVWGQLFAYIPKAEDIDSEGNVFSVPAQEPTLEQIPRATEIFAIIDIWRMLRILTVEYLGKKADLLVVLGKLDTSVRIRVDAPDLVAQAKEAFWHKRADAPVLLVMAVRDALLKKMNVFGELKDGTLYFSTAQLLLIATHSGVIFSHPADTLSGIIHDLETLQDLQEAIEFSYFYPVFRVLIDTIEKLNSDNGTEEIHNKASQIILENIQRKIGHEA